MGTVTKRYLESLKSKTTRATGDDGTVNGVDVEAPPVEETEETFDFGGGEW
jgi:hypothetical protein